MSRVTTEERQRLKDLEKENRELRRANEIANSIGRRKESCEMSDSNHGGRECKDTTGT